MREMGHSDLCSSCHYLAILSIALLLTSSVASAATFSFVNSCGYTVWPGILANAGSPVLETTGFELPRGTMRSLQAPTGWSGRFWARTGCNFDGSGSGSGSSSAPGSCETGDCGSGQVTCDGNGAATPVTLAEVTLGSGGQDFYDVSLVDGYNVPMILEAVGGSGGTCASTGCVADLNRQCPPELTAGDGKACKSACVAFGTPEDCCSGTYGSPLTCKPSVYAHMFKLACPTSYSYAYDDASSTFTCAGADYTITFCPSTPSQKSSTPATPTTPNQAGQGMGMGAETGAGAVPGSGIGAEQGSGSGSGSAAMTDGSWLAGLAMGGSARPFSPGALKSALIACATLLSLMFYFAHL